VNGLCTNAAKVRSNLVRIAKKKIAVGIAESGVSGPCFPSLSTNAPGMQPELEVPLFLWDLPAVPSRLARIYSGEGVN
jgi:hypothetical protein